MNRPEQDIQIAVVSHLAARGKPGVFWFHPMNAGKRSLFVAKKLKAAGLVPGVPDLVLIKGGEVFGLELKAKKGRTSPSQRLAHAAMQEAGAITAIAHGLDEALVTLESWGILKRDEGKHAVCN